MEKQITAYLAAKDYEDNLKYELGDVEQTYGRLMICNGFKENVYWAQNIWYNPIIVKIKSINDAITTLKSIQRNWASYSVACHRRTQLIQDGLPRVSKKSKLFPMEKPASPMGSFCLLDENTMMYASNCSNPFANGEINLQENKLEPPSRAYLKLQEALVLAGAMPKENELCLDAGACPGGWTWVLVQLGARVIAIDRSELDQNLMSNPLVTFMKHSAFTIKPEEIGAIDWFFSDIICYPPKLFEWISQWMDSGLCKKFICTIKMQGDCDWETLKKFRAVPNSKIIHLSNNKHELTWIKID